MVRFVLLAALINATPLALFALGRHAVSRWRWPGLWWLAAGTAAILATLQAARSLL